MARRMASPTGASGSPLDEELTRRDQRIHDLEQELLRRDENLQSVRDRVEEIEARAIAAAKWTASTRAETERAHGLELQRTVAAAATTLNAEIVRLRKEVFSLETEMAQLEDDKVQLKEEKTQLGVRLGGEKAQLEGEKAQLEGEKAWLEGEKGRLEGEKAQLESALVQSRSDYANLINSTSWKITAPLRGSLSLMPASMRRFGRRALRLIFWVLTPWRIPARLRARRT
jgi:chromosome segregation ATPase